MAPSKPQPPIIQDPCAAARDLIGAYSIGATDDHETALVEAALADCPELAADMAEYLALSDALLHLVPMTEDPPPLADLPAAFRDLPRTTTYSTHHIPQPIPLEPLMEPLLEPSITHLHGSTPAIPVGHHHKVIDFDTAATAPARNTRGWFVAAAAAAALFLLSNVYWLTQVNALRDEQAQLRAQIVEAQDAMQPVMVRVPASEQHQRDLTATDVGIEGAHATVLWNTGNANGSLHVTGLPELQGEATYQLWLVRGEEAISMGTFEVSNNGTGIIVFEAPEPIETYEAIGISVEPGEGSSYPTTPHVVIGEI